MSFWSSQTLKLRLHDLIEPFEEDRIQSASYELCVGKEVYISPLPDTKPQERKKIIFKEKETVAIPPGQFAYLITSETVSVPNNAIAFISMKFKPKAKGLINVSGFHVDPGYKGRLIFAVYNAGPLNFHVECGERLFAIWFADLDATDAHARTQAGFDSIPTEILNVPDLVSSLPYLVKRLESLESKVESYTFRQGIYLTIVLGIFLAIIPFIPSWSKQLVDTYFSSNVKKTQPVKRLLYP